MSRGWAKGFRANLPLAASVVAYGSVLGVLASQKGLAWSELLAMNILVFAGSAQFVMVEMWHSALPLVEMTLAVAVINLRYLLIGATLQPLFASRSLAERLSIMHFVADENWAVTMAALRKGDTDTFYLLGGGLCILLFWCLGTMVGISLGSAITDPRIWALDFAFTAVFTALAVSLWRGRRDLVPWLSAFAAACLAERLLPGKWYILVGGLTGALASAWPGNRRQEDHP